MANGVFMLVTGLVPMRTRVTMMSRPPLTGPIFFLVLLLASHNSICSVCSLKIKDMVPEFNVMTDKVKFYLYTRKLQDYQLVPAQVESFVPHFVRGAMTKFILHGLRRNFKTQWVQQTKDAYLETGDVNVILVDYEVLARSARLIMHPISICGIAHSLAQFLDILAQAGLVSGSKVHLIGHSMGASVAAATARISKVKVHRVTGLDPGNYLFLFCNANAKQAATISDAIHTDAGMIGTPFSWANVDFWPNGGLGAQQPMCKNPVTSPGCSHGIVHEYFIESIKSKTAFLSQKCCNSIQKAFGKCSQNETTHMGEHMDPGASGSFCLSTNAQSPYSKS